LKYEKLENHINRIKEKYSYQKHNVSEYIEEIDNEFYEFGAVTDNIAYERVLNNVISGEDCIDYVMGADPKKFYHWKDVSGKLRVTEVDYELYSELVDEALVLTKEFENKKEKDFDIC